MISVVPSSVIVFTKDCGSYIAVEDSGEDYVYAFATEEAAEVFAKACVESGAGHFLKCRACVKEITASGFGAKIFGCRAGDYGINVTVSPRRRRVAKPS